jgi:protein-arginine kinase activator protein McsA
MAEHKYAELKSMTVAKLREIAQGIQSPELEGYSTWHKEQLLPVLCKLLNIPMHHIAHGAEKTRVKGVIRKLETKREEVLKAHDYKRLTIVRRQIHVLKHKLRNMAESAPV